MNKKFHFNDILIEPITFSDIRSRSEINPFDENGYLPIFTAPMYDVVDNSNWHKFTENNIYSIIPRGKWNIGEKPTFNKWSAVSLEEFIENFLDSGLILDEPAYILIDVANGHMGELLDCATEAKERYGDNLVLMVGNIANPEAYKLYSKAGVDYVRIGIGNGCFVDGTKIKTKDGEKNIEDIEPGDMVLTHKNRYRKVLQTHRRAHVDDIITINGNIQCTPNHEFYVLNKKYVDIVNDDNIHDLCEWKSAMELLNNSDYLLIENE